MNANNPMRFKNKIVIITGASRGIGRETAKLFAEEGASLVIDYYPSEDYEPDAEKNAISLLLEIEAIHGNAIIVNCDVRDEKQIQDLLDKTLSAFGKVDILVNNAGYVNDKPIEERTIQDWHRTVDTNLLGTYLCTKIISTKMQNEGAIVNASSTNIINCNNPESLDYDASKAGIISLTKNFAKALAPRNIRVNATCLGWGNTDMNTQLPQDFLNEEQSQIYLRRFANLSEVAKLTLFLASNDASYITGTTVVIDGGHD